MMDIGCDQAYLLAKQIEKMNLRIGVIIAGSLLRTRQTASIISGVLGMVPVEIEPLINERRLGQWNNRPIEDTEEQLKQRMTPPGGESEDQFEARIAMALENLKPHFERRPLIVSSKGVGPRDERAARRRRPHAGRQRRDRGIRRVQADRPPSSRSTACSAPKGGPA
jgi:probable phosphoglycerate mutase